MTKSALSLLLVTIIVTHQANALTDVQLEPIRKLGEINGVALKCQYLKQVKEIKLSLAKSLPKQRGLGELFEEETNRSFLKFIQSGQRCPGEATIEDMIHKEIGVMKERFIDHNNLK